MILDLDVNVFELFCQAIPIIEAQEMLSDFKVQDWSNMKETARSKLHSHLSKTAFNSISTGKKEAKKISNEDLARILSKR